MVRLSLFAAGLLAATSLTACSRNNTPAPQAANQAAPAPQADSDHGDDDDAVETAPPRISLEPREPRPAPEVFVPVEENATVEPMEEEPPAPSIFRSLGRALRRGVTETVQGAGDDTVDPPATEEAAPPEPQNDADSAAPQP